MPMLRIPLPSPDSALLFQPRFGDRPLLLLLICLTPLALTVWLYRYELRLVRPNIARTLLGLRFLVVLLLVLVAAFQPVVAHSTSESLPGRVVIAVDRSDSMGVADPQRPLIDKLRLARALNLTADVCPNSLLDAWIKQLQTPGSQNYPDGERKPIQQAVRRIDTLTRSQIARSVLAPESGGLVDAVGRMHRLELYGFGASISPLAPDQLDSLLQSAGSAGAATDLRLPLLRALEQPSGDSGKTLGVILLTDGQHNTGGTPTEKAAELGNQHIPVYPIALGSRVAPVDVAITDVKAPASAFKGTDVPVKATLKVRGLSERDLTVELQRPGREPMIQRVHHTGGDNSYPVLFEVRVDTVGPQTFTVYAPPDPDETRTENNTHKFTVNVTDDKAKVLLIDGEARWEFHYLASALARDHSMEVKSVLFAQPRLGKIAEEDLERTGNPALNLPPEPDALASFDCIVLGDVTPEQLPAADRVRLEKYVGERGGTLVLLAGKRAMPLAFAGADADDPLQRLLPIMEPRVLSVPEGFYISPTAEGKQSALPEIGDPRRPLPPKHYWAVIGKAKPGATVLATVGAGNADDPKEAAEDEKRWALIARQNFGLGRVLFVGLDSTWRWRYKAGDTYHHRFWGQVMRWAASDKPLVAGNEFVRFGTRAPVYAQGQDVEIAARLGDAVKPLTPGALAGARVLRLRDGQPDERVSLVNLTKLETRPRELDGKVRDLPSGQYAVELVIPELGDKLNGPPGPDGQPTKLRAMFTVTPPENKEMEDVATNFALLEEIAVKSGGKVFLPENASELADLLAKRAATRTYRSDLKLWQSWWTLIVFLTLLTLEWVGRKWAGLP